MSLDTVISDLNKKFKSEIIVRGTSRIYVEKIPFSSPRINYMTYGGIPIGKSTELLGPDGGGKTTTALDLCGQAQRYAVHEWLKKNQEGNKRRVVYFDLENTLDEEWAELNGVDIEDLIIVRPDDQTAEQVLNMVMSMLETGEVLMLVIDSTPMLIPQNLYDEDMEKKGMGGIASILADFSRRVSPLLTKHHIALVSINQVRDDFNNPFNQFHTPGGRAWKHFHSLRLFCRKGNFLDKDNKEVPQRTEDPIGNIVDVTIVKTKVCKPDRRIGQYTLNYTEGIDVIGDTVFMAIKYDFIHQSGAWFSIMDLENGAVMKSAEGELKFQGKPKLLEYLKEDQELFDEIYQAVNLKVTEVNQ